MPTYRLDLAYDGTGFHGYARQPGLPTVQERLEEALFRITGPVDTVVAGRTDAGVHAHGQVVSFATSQEVDASGLDRALNRMLNPEIAITRASAAPDGFNARYSARLRSYRYRILNAARLDPMRARVTWHVAHDLDVEAMSGAAAQWVGEHDFASLCRRVAGRSTIRKVVSAEWTVADDEVRFDISAESFCQQMVRSAVALAVAVGRGLIPLDDVAGIMAARDRQQTPGVAPPQGLSLWAVEY